jgi:hypothetical protein
VNRKKTVTFFSILTTVQAYEITTTDEVVIDNGVSQDPRKLPEGGLVHD